jgi:hypothetical protein
MKLTVGPVTVERDKAASHDGQSFEVVYITSTELEGLGNTRRATLAEVVLAKRILELEEQLSYALHPNSRPRVVL